ncbi:MAG: hypothetical protein JKY09_07800, partial [Crocinitomicaceae bacterium]|nr:hypothetical protein [Crocinitomicaceae bacterium]
TQKTGLVHSSFSVPVDNRYTYSISYFQSGKNDPVYRSPILMSNTHQQAITNPLKFGSITFVGKGFQTRETMLIQLKMDGNPIRLTPQEDSYTIPCLFSPEEHLVTYEANLITRKGKILMRPVTRPVAATIEIGADVPWWFSVQIDPTLIQWDKVSVIEVNMQQGTMDIPGKVETIMFLPEARPRYWGFEYKRENPPHYCWSSTYWYKDGTSKIIELHNDGSLNILVLPANPQNFNN